VRIGTIVVILMLVYVGFLFVVARGSDTKLSEARQALLWTIVGALILLGAQAISLGIQATVTALSPGN
jgi:heme/copper-type cytochrome/quinol oxidase subunit 2